MDVMFTVFIVDDDASVIKALSRLIRLKGYDAQSYTSPQEFLTHHDAAVPGCAYSMSPCQVSMVLSYSKH
jgi:FixJ family two-component response regulator